MDKAICIDPGDGLASDCEHSEMYERIWQEATEAAVEAARAAASEELARVTKERDELRESGQWGDD